MRPNERLSGRRQARHLCKDCHKLSPEQLTYRQATRNIERMIQWETGRVKRKQRNHFARLLQHPDERIRRYPESVAAGEAAPHVANDFTGPPALERLWEEEEGRGPA